MFNSMLKPYRALTILISLHSLLPSTTQYTQNRPAIVPVCSFYHSHVFTRDSRKNMAVIEKLLKTNFETVIVTNWFQENHTRVCMSVRVNLFHWYVSPRGNQTEYTLQKVDFITPFITGWIDVEHITRCLRRIRNLAQNAAGLDNQSLEPSERD